ncbi:Tyrosine recombinase XerC [subsurface metagenome]
MTGTPITLTTEDADKLLYELLHQKGSWKKHIQGIRNHCIALLMLDAGLRVGEVVGQTISNLYFLNESRYSLLVSSSLSHGSADRTIPLTQRIRKAIEAMQVHLWSQTGKVGLDYAFTSNYRTGLLTTRQVERIIRKAAMMSLGRPVHPHALRHTFASRVMRTTNIRIVQELLGHKHLSSTQIYTHPNQEDLKNAIESLDRNQPNNDVTES